MWTTIIWSAWLKPLAAMIDLMKGHIPASLDIHLLLLFASERCFLYAIDEGYG